MMFKASFIFSIFISVWLNVPVELNPEKNYPEYKLEWEKIDSMLSDKLLEEALKKIEIVFDKAVSSKNHPQIIKSLIYLENIKIRRDSEGLASAIPRLERKLPEIDYPAKSILYSLLGQYYLDLANRWEITQQLRTEILGEEQDTLDLQTWSKNNLYNKSKDYVLKSLENTSSKNEVISDYRSILYLAEDTAWVTTLFDLLAYKAIMKFKSGNFGLVSFGQEFELKTIMSPFDEFKQLNFDPNSEWGIFQKLLNHQLSKGQAKAMHLTNLARLKYAFETRREENEAFGLYRESLKDYYNLEKNNTWACNILYELLELIYIQSKLDNEYKDSYSPKKISYNEVDSLADRLLLLKPDSIISGRANGIRAELRLKNLNVNMESCIPTSEYSKILVEYRNVFKQRFKIYKLANNECNDFNSRWSEEKLKILRKTKPFREWEDQWPESTDFKKHSVELKMDPLPFGYYLLTGEDNRSLAYNSSIEFQVSNLAAVVSQSKDQEDLLVVVNRKTGAAIKNAEVEFFQSKILSSSGVSQCNMAFKLKSDADGLVRISEGCMHHYLNHYKVKFKNDLVWGNGSIYEDKDESDGDYFQSHFFTDRLIYRPGQTVHYKILSLQMNSRDHFPKILANKNLEIEFRDANNKEISKQQVLTNAFGTASGSFVIPIGSLKGKYSLDSWGDRFSIQVEDYKRPGFEVRMDSIKEQYKLNQEVDLSGFVKTYSGVPLAGAKIQFEVYHTVGQFPFFRNSFYKVFPPSNRQLLVSGNAESKEDGSFNIKFIATNSDEKETEIHHFEVEIDALDLNGETQSTQMNFKLSRQSVFAKTNLKERITPDDLRKIEIRLQNIEEVKVKADFQVQFYKLKSEEIHLKSRYWEKPDVQKYSRKQFRKYFPNDVFLDENKLKGMELGELLFDKAYTNVSELKLDLFNLLYNQHHVRCLIFANQENFDSLIYTHNFSIFNNGQKLKSTQPLCFSGVNQVSQNSNLGFQFSGPPDKIHFFTQYNSRKHQFAKLIDVKNQFELTQFVGQEDAGHVYLSSFTILHNRFYHFDIPVSVNWDNKKLEINTETFRNQTFPGAKEEWSFVLKSPDHNMDSIELMASMYDASLDQIIPFQWNPVEWPDYSNQFYLSSDNFSKEFMFLISDSNKFNNNWPRIRISDFNLPSLWVDSYIEEVAIGRNSFSFKKIQTDGDMAAAQSGGGYLISDEQDSEDKIVEVAEQNSPIEQSHRKNLNETVFFYPHLVADSNQRVKFQFNMNEALTRWKLQLFAHSKDMKTGYKALEVITSKPVQIKPFYPRFLRHGDQMELRATVSNLSENKIIGTAKLEILNASNLQNISDQFNIKQSNDQVQLEVGQSESVVWNLKVPDDMTNAVILRYSVVSDQHKDGEEKSVAVVSNRKLLTQTLAMHVPAKSTKEYNFSGINNAFVPGAKPHSFTIEFTSNPVWYAIQSLPYLSDYPHECSEQLMSQIFANSIGSHIMEKMPRVKTVLQRLLADGQQLSPLLKNQELKSALIAETPWVLEAESDSEQMRRVALLMDFNLMNQQVKSTIDKLGQRQNSDGSFSWFPGTWPDRTITQHIVSQIAHLQKLGVIEKREGDLQSIVLKASKFLDQSIQEDYNRIEKLVKEGKAKWEDQHISALQVQYLYAASYYSDWFSKIKSTVAVKYWMEQMNVYWRKMNIYDQAMCALVFHRMKDQANSKLIIESLRQRSIQHAELGMYWKIPRSYYWNQLPIETQAMLIEAFYEITKDVKSCDQMKLWLLKNKQTQHWGTTKATSLAVYAILQYATDWTNESQETKISLNNQVLVPKDQLAGSLYFKEKFESSQVKKEFSKIKAVNPNPHASWGAAYVQYWQDLDQIKDDFGYGLSISQELYKKVIIDQKEKLIPIKGKEKLSKGDLVTVRCVIKSDRPMEYVHLKMMRASGLELIVQLSGYEWKSGLGYYKSPGDLSTDFFISYLPAGTFVFEYDLRAAFTGSFSNGVSTIQCMYAPEFNANSKGIVLTID